MNAKQFQIPAIQLNFDAYLADKAKREAMTRVEQHADTDWKTYALETVKRVAQQFAEFTTDAVLEQMQNAPVWTHELRALGPVMMSAQRAGYITRTDKTTPTKRVSRHHTEIRVWKSNLHKGV